MYLEGVGDLSFYLGEDAVGEQGTVIGLVNIAAFLAQSMKETIKYDACDENNWDVIDGKFISFLPLCAPSICDIVLNYSIYHSLS